MFWRSLLYRRENAWDSLKRRFGNCVRIRFEFGFKFRDDLFRLAVKYHVAFPILESFTADSELMVTALETFEQKPAVRLALSDGDVIDENLCLRWIGQNA